MLRPEVVFERIVFTTIRIQHLSPPLFDGLRICNVAWHASRGLRAVHQRLIPLTPRARDRSWKRLRSNATPTNHRRPFRPGVGRRNAPDTIGQIGGTEALPILKSAERPISIYPAVDGC